MYWQAESRECLYWMLALVVLHVASKNKSAILRYEKCSTSIFYIKNIIISNKLWSQLIRTLLNLIT